MCSKLMAHRSMLLGVSTTVGSSNRVTLSTWVYTRRTVSSKYEITDVARLCKCTTLQNEGVQDFTRSRVAQNVDVDVDVDVKKRQ
jgi:hypothetical protein